VTPLKGVVFGGVAHTLDVAVELKRIDSRRSEAISSRKGRQGRVLEWCPPALAALALSARAFFRIGIGARVVKRGAGW
jgi:hypothetical protein